MPVFQDSLSDYLAQYKGHFLESTTWLFCLKTLSLSLILKQLSYCMQPIQGRALHEALLDQLYQSFHILRHKYVLPLSSEVHNVVMPHPNITKIKCMYQIRHLRAVILNFWSTKHYLWIYKQVFYNFPGLCPVPVPSFWILKHECNDTVTGC